MQLAWSRSLKVIAYPETLAEGDKIILPNDALQDLLALEPNLPSPLTFELRHPESRTIIHGGVREFSGESGTVQLPSWMADTLHVKPGDKVIVRHRDLPKGTWVKLYAHSSSDQAVDYRAALEAHLRSYFNTLTTGQPLTCRYGAHTFSFTVADLKPAPAVCVNDTDLEVDLESTLSPGSTLAGSNQPTSVLTLESAAEQVTVAKDTYRYWKLEAGPEPIAVVLAVSSGDADLVVSPDPLPTVDHHVWSSLTSAEKRTLPLVGRTASFVYVGVHAFGDDANVSLTAILAPSSPNSGTPENDTHTDKEQCPTCEEWVTRQNMERHRIFCSRNRVQCPQGCGKIFLRNSNEAKNHWHCDRCSVTGDSHDKPKHILYEHTERTCSCQQFSTCSVTDLSRHRQSSCADRLITCRYCHNLVLQGALSNDPHDRLLQLHAHESYCGSRTITCQKCQRQIPIKNVPVHAKIHEVERQNQKLPPLCSNQNCIRARTSNRLCLCQFCFGPFWIPEDDPKYLRLIQRLARKLHTGLTVGCGQAWCRNQYCATGTGHPMDPTSAASTLLPLVQSVSSQLNQQQGKSTAPLFLCVDETITRQKFLAETLFESTHKAYALNWCVKALTETREDLDRAEQWLTREAPKTARVD